MTSQPLFSIIIPTYNRASDLRRALTGYEAQLGGVPFELVVVDDGSSDGTARLLEQWRERHPNLNFTTTENGGPARARNLGLQLARGRFILFTGDDIVPNRDFLLSHKLAHEEYSDEGVAILGHIEWPPDLVVTSTMQHVDGVGAQQFSFRFFENGASYDFRHFYTSNISVARSLLDREPSGFSTDFPSAAFEDAEYAYRLRRHGLRIVYRSEPRAVHYHPYVVSSFFERQVRCGQMAALFYSKFPELRKWFDLKYVDQLRAEALLAQVTSGRVVSPLPQADSDFDRLESRALRLAAFYDHNYVPPLDDLLHALFRYGYLKGVAMGVYPSEEGWLSRILFEREVIPAVAAFTSSMTKLGLPFPIADSTPILELAA